MQPYDVGDRNPFPAILLAAIADIVEDSGMTKTYRVRDAAGKYRSVRGDDVIELARQCILDRFKAGPSIKSPADSEKYLQTLLGHREHEVFAVLFLDNRHRVLHFEEMFRGTVDGTSVYPREVVKQALAVNAAAVILAHNHPSMVPEPSQADERITKRLKDALALVDIRVLDHMIVGQTVTSMASRGLI